MTTEYTGHGDPVRSMELLWGAQAKPSRGPKPKLTVDQVASAAIEIADADGLAALSMRRVAERAGVSTMSLYTYVPGKAELLDVMTDRAAGELPLVEAESGHWRDTVELWARQAWAQYHRHPWILQVATGHPAFGPNDAAQSEHRFAAMSGIGLSDREIVAMLGAVDGYVRGMARASVDAARVEERTGVTDEHWYTSRAALLEKLLTRDLFPTMNRFWETGVFDEPGDDFDFGLQRLLDGVEFLIASRQR